MLFVQLLTVLAFLCRAYATTLDTTIKNIASPVASRDTGIFSKAD